MGMAIQGNGHQEQAALLQLIAEGIRSPSAGRLSPAQLECVAGMLDRIAVDLLVPTTDEGTDASHLGSVDETNLHTWLHS
jgi:hypothetical protein